MPVLKVDDAERKAREITMSFVAASLDDKISAGHNMAVTQKAIAAAIREARQQGMRDAAEIARTYEDWCANWGEIGNEVVARECSKEIAETIDATCKEDV